MDEAVRQKQGGGETNHDSPSAAPARVCAGWVTPSGSVRSASDRKSHHFRTIRLQQKPKRMNVGLQLPGKDASLRRQGAIGTMAAARNSDVEKAKATAR